MRIIKNMGVILLFSIFLYCSCTNYENVRSTLLSEFGQDLDVNLDEERTKEKAKEAYEFCEKNDYNTDFCVLIDMKIHSGKYRMFVWDFKKDSITLKALCAHGIGKGSTTKIPVFSNESGSYCSSLGKYKLGARANSNYGIKIHYKMHGLEETNSNAYKRIIVLHSHIPVPEEEIYPDHLPLGWSLGCPVTDDNMMKELDKLLKNQKKSTLLWIYY